MKEGGREGREVCRGGDGTGGKGRIGGRTEGKMAGWMEGRVRTGFGKAAYILTAFAVCQCLFREAVVNSPCMLSLFEHAFHVWVFAAAF